MNPWLLSWLGEKGLLPMISWGLAQVSRVTPGWLTRLRARVRISRLELEITSIDRLILELIATRPASYRDLDHRFGEAVHPSALLLAVTRLQVLNLLNPPLLHQPPHPRSLLTISRDARALLQSRQARTARIRPRRRDIPEATTRRQRAGDHADWLARYDDLSHHGDALPADWAVEAIRRRQQLADDQLWLNRHGF